MSINKVRYYFTGRRMIFTLNYDNFGIFNPNHNFCLPDKPKESKLGENSYVRIQR